MHVPSALHTPGQGAHEGAGVARLVDSGRADTPTSDDAAAPDTVRREGFGEGADAGIASHGHTAAELGKLVGVGAQSDDVFALAAARAAVRAATQVTVRGDGALGEGLLANVTHGALALHAGGVEVLAGPLRGRDLFAHLALNATAAAACIADVEAADCQDDPLILDTPNCEAACR